MEQAPDRALQRAPRGHVRAVGVAVHEGKGAVVDASQEDRVAVRPLMVHLGTVAREPHAEVQVVDRVEAPDQQAVDEDARQRRYDHVHGAGQELDVGVLGERVGEVLAHPGVEPAEQARVRVEVAGAALVGEVPFGQAPGHLEQVVDAEVVGALDVDPDVAAGGVQPVAAERRRALDCGGDLVVVRLERADAALDPAQDLAEDVDEGALALGAGVVRRLREREHVPIPVHASVPHRDVVAALERAAPGRQRLGPLVPVQRGVAAAHDREGVVVAAEPHVQAVLLDAHAQARETVAAARALSAQAVARLIHGDLVLFLERRRRRQLERRRQGRRAAAEDCHARPVRPLTLHRDDPLTGRALR